MNFIQKGILKANGGSIYFAQPYQNPSTCPCCGIETDAITANVQTTSYGKGGTLFIVSYECTHCQNRFVGLFEKIKLGDNEALKYIEVLPRPAGKELHQGLAKISPRFVEVHKEAEGAEQFGFFDLAAMGYRKALEILVKDYAITMLDKSKEEVEKKKLDVAIGTYLQQKELVKTADVVRILGNDRTHYKEKYPEHEFPTLKRYYDIFLQLIITQYEIANPPVERKQP